MAKVWSQQVQVSLVGAIAISGIGVGASASAQSQQLTSVATQDVIGLNVTSVSQLSDVRPTDWAFTALQSLIERYGCIAGYP
ncbi:MAG: porin, partial [Pseudanabaena sp.]